MVWSLEGEGGGGKGGGMRKGLGGGRRDGRRGRPGDRSGGRVVSDPPRGRYWCVYVGGGGVRRLVLGGGEG